MTKEEYKKSYHDLNSQIENLRTKIRDLKNEYISHSPLKIGDKVIVTLDSRKEVECFISGIDVKTHLKDGYNYSFAKVNKDGTMSGQSASIYYPKSVRKAD